jgi:6-phosphogluconate dehydrogenase
LKELDLDVAAIAESWRHGTVMRSWLLDLTAEFLAEDAGLQSMHRAGRFRSGAGPRSSHPEARGPLSALMERFASQDRGDYANRILARLRQSFGGHAVTKG